MNIKNIGELQKSITWKTIEI